MRIARGISIANVNKPISTAPAYDADATAFFTAASITDTTQKNAVNTLVISLKSANIWTKMKALYPVVGGSASSHAVNLKQPGTFNLSFATGWTHSSTGMTPNGAAYANTNLTPSTILSSFNSVHISNYRRTTVNNGFVMIGAISGATVSAYVRLTLAPNYNGTYHNISEIISTGFQQSSNDILDIGLIQGNRISNSEFKLFANSILKQTVTRTALSLPTVPIYIGGLNFNNSPTDYTTNPCAFASIGDGLTDAEALSFYNAVQTYQTTLGRQV